MEAFHYLVKPFSDKKLAEVLERALEKLLPSPAAQKPTGPCLLIQTGGAHIKVPLDDIVYAEVFNRKILLHTYKETLEYYGRLSALCSQAGPDFFRPHRSYLVPFKSVDRYDASSIRLDNGVTIPMARQKYHEFVQSFLQYHRRKGSGQ